MSDALEVKNDFYAGEEEEEEEIKGSAPAAEQSDSKNDPDLKSMRDTDSQRSLNANTKQ